MALSPLSVLAQPLLTPSLCGHTRNFEKSDVFCTKKCGHLLWKSLSKMPLHKSLHRAPSLLGVPSSSFTPPHPSEVKKPPIQGKVVETAILKGLPHKISKN